MRILIALLLGAGLAAIVACGSSKSMSARSAQPAAMAGHADPNRARIEELDAKIGADLAKLNLERPPTPAPTCANPPCPDRMSATPVKPTSDPTCKPGPSEACKDSCTLADSICDSAGRICEIAAELKNDAWAIEKCGSGKASCDVAGERCCGCQL